ncbi:MAG: 6-phospho-3-hexuloisomerase [Edaphobacter sp.]|uniref:6-phospho-3-hexuloisomerase n=1 Tax=Edaphobacter sp. TaxID=1934404 RepID=UPI0023940790|nr:6-phospho-3-hexuloisomerase [Edaphobacter sp.]MDE1176860.1 6-phospho-3-hexuloisomerase [Edaphobacter sp.]
MASLAETTGSSLTDSSLAEASIGDRALILGELERAVTAMSGTEMAAAAEEILAARRVFVIGAGRSGLALKMAAMRLMHLGLTVHVAGEVTTPAIAAGDLLIAASGSGSTAGVVQAAKVAARTGARVLAITAAPASMLGGMADAVLTIPAAMKQEHGGAISAQYAGALFEQSLLVAMDAIFQGLWRQRGESAEELWTRHANLE